VNKLESNKSKTGYVLPTNDDEEDNGGDYSDDDFDKNVNAKKSNVKSS
jgi:hypothetical protein